MLRWIWAPKASLLRSQSAYVVCSMDQTTIEALRYTITLRTPPLLYGQNVSRGGFTDFSSKLKVHSLVGVTLNLKGFVGTQGDKNYIPHHRVGNVLRRGDEHPDLGLSQNLLNRYRMWLLTTVLSRRTPVVDRLYRMLFPFQRYAQRLLDRWGQFRQGSKYRGNITGGAWYGNDTAWRMALDLSRIVLYSDKEGRLRQAPQRHFFSLVDGVLAGEGQGPYRRPPNPVGDHGWVQPSRGRYRRSPAYGVQPRPN